MKDAAHSDQSCRWCERAHDAAVADGLREKGLSRLMARLLSSRGVTADTLESYLHPKLSDLAPPDSLHGVAEAVEAVLAAVEAGKKTVVFGDYDCDGICATAIAVTAIRALGADVEPFIPSRQSEGYGMTLKSIERMIHEHPGVGLVVTVDNGINCADEVAELARRGIETVVTDHHLPSAKLPGARAIVNPKVASPSCFEGLCGAGVAFMFANHLINTARKRRIYSGGNIGGSLLVLAGLATVTDIMPLAGQNRILVAEALNRFRILAPAGLQRLYGCATRSASRSKYAVQPMSTRDFSFLLGPRINAAGRIASGMDALELILCKDVGQMECLAQKVDRFNDERKSIERDMTELALSRIVPGASAQVIELPEGHPGVAGIVAARVMERLTAAGKAVPVCVVVDGHGSARSPNALNICTAMQSCASWLTRFGGHAAAGGFQVVEGKIDEFRRALCDYCDKHGQIEELSECAVDAWVTADDLTLELAEAIARMEPFGEGNPEPVFAMHTGAFADVRPMGADGRHLQVTFRDRSIPCAVWWNKGDLIEKLRSMSTAEHDIRFTVEISTYGERHLELRLQSVI